MLCSNLILIDNIWARLQCFKNLLGGDLDESGGMYVKLFTVGSKFVSAALAALTLDPQNTPD